MKCPGCGRLNSNVLRCNGCGDVRCSFGDCTGTFPSSPPKTGAVNNGTCKVCKKGKYVKVS